MLKKTVFVASASFYILIISLAQTNITQAATSTPLTYQVIDNNLLGWRDAKSVGDIDGDGFADVIIGGSALQWYKYPTWTKTVIATPLDQFTTDMQVGDIDNDGDLDIIVPDGNGTNNVLWFENPRPLGNPAIDAWTRHVIGTSGTYAHDVEVGDIDGDGKLDVVTRLSSTNIFFQNSPTSWTKVTVSSRPNEGTALGDIDGDGDLDIAINGYWLENPLLAGSPRTTAWSEHLIDTNWPSEVGVYIADVNVDGRADVLLAPSESTNGRLSWYETLDPKLDPWTEHVVDSSVEYIHTFKTADMDLDGTLDIVTAEMHQSADPDEVSVYHNQGAGLTWVQQIVANSGSHNIRLVDMGNDGDIDIMGANWLPDSPIELWENTTALPLDKWNYIQVSNAHSQTFGLAFGDIDSDTLSDMVSGKYWYKNPGGDLTGVWVQSGVFPNDVEVMLTTNVDGDGFADVIAQKTEGAELGIYWLEALNSSGTSWNFIRIGDVPVASHPIGAQGYRTADIRPGGREEILISSGAGIWYFEVPANPASDIWNKVQVNANPSDEGFGVADIDRDGFLDVVAGTGNTKLVQWYKNPGTAAANWSAFTIGNMNEVVFPDRFAAADLNGDGRVDIIATEENGLTSGAQTFWWEQPLDPTAPNWVRRTIVTQGTTNSMDISDMDNDGDSDIVLAEHRGALKMAVWKNDGIGNFIEQLIDIGKESHLGARVVDIDQDGDKDLVSIAFDASQFVHLWRNNAITGGVLPPDVIPPVISSINVSNISSTDVTITWTTNEPATNRVEYGFTPVYGSTTATSSSLVLSHTVLLSGLTASTTYHYRVINADGSGNISTSSDFIFTTLGAPPPSSNGLVAHWKLDDGSGLIALDSSGNGTTGTLQGNPVWSIGKIGGSLDFNGVNQYVSLPNIDVVGTGITIATWVNFDSFPSNSDARFVSKATNVFENDHYWMLGQTNNGNNRLRFRLKTDGNTNTLIASSGNLSVNTWYHVAAVYDGSAMKLFLDGVEVGSVAKSGTISTNSSVPVNLARNPDGSNYLDAELDEVRIYNRGLSANEIIEVMNDTGVDATPPMRSNGSPSGTLPETATSTVVSLITNENATCKYATTAGISYDSMLNVFTTTGTLNHSSSVSVSAGIAYSFYVRCQDSLGNTNTDDFVISFSVAVPDTTPPSVPTGLVATAVSTTQIDLSWNASSDNIGVVGYTVFRDGLQMATTTALTYQNTGLSSSTTYSYTVSAFDLAGNQSVQSLSAQATTLTPDTTPPVITNVLTTGITTNSATVTWTTNEPADSQVEYGLNTAYGSSTPLSSSMVNSHSQSLSGLSASTTYHFRVKSRDVALNLSVSPDFTFTTNSVPLIPDIIAHWKLNELSGIIAADSSGNNRTGTLVNGPVWTSSGQIAGALTFDGSNDYISIPTFDVSGSAMTMTAWVKFSSLPTSIDQRFLSKADNSSEAGHYWMFGHTYTGSAHRLRFRLKTGGNTTTLIASSGNLAVNTWYHASAVYDGSTMRLFLNGVEVGSVSKSGTISASSSVNVNLGRNPGGSANNFSGTMDEVRIYNRALTAQEISLIMIGN